jgi:hypothetical protein
MAYSKQKLKSSEDKASPSLKSFLDTKIIWQMFTYTDFAIRLI